MIKNYFPIKSHKEINLKQLLITWQKKELVKKDFHYQMENYYYLFLPIKLERDHRP